MGTKGKRAPATPLRPAPRPTGAEAPQGLSTSLLPATRRAETDSGRSVPTASAEAAQPVGTEVRPNVQPPSIAAQPPTNIGARVGMMAPSGAAKKSSKPKTKPAEPAFPASDSPWVNYLTGKKVSADSFLQDMQDGVVTTTDEAGKQTKQKTDRINVPDDTAKGQFGEALSIKPELVERLLLLVQSAPAYSIVIQRIVMDLAEHGVQRAGALTLPEPPTTETYPERVSAWLSAIAERPLKPTPLSILLLLLHIGRYRHVLDTALKLVASALSQAPKPRQGQNAERRPGPTLLDVLLALPLQQTLLADVTAYAVASQADQAKLQTKVEAQATQISNIVADNEALTAAVADLRAKYALIQEQLAAAERTVGDLEKQNLGTRASYQHKLDDVRGRIRGLLQGQITRWLETSLDAARATPPRVGVVEERLEEALKLIEKEIQWLQPSG